RRFATATRKRFSNWPDGVAPCPSSRRRKSRGRRSPSEPRRTLQTTVSSGDAVPYTGLTDATPGLRMHGNNRIWVIVRNKGSDAWEGGFRIGEVTAQAA